MNNKYGMKHIPFSKVKHLQNKKFFELKDLDIFKDCWCFFIKGRKGIGKSYSLKTLINNVASTENDMFIYLRTRREDMRSALASFNRGNDYNIYAKNTNLYDKKTNRLVGICGYANNLTSLKSGNYTNFKYIIYDEYVESIDSNYRNKEVFAPNFMRFIMDVYRDLKKNGKVSDLKVYCFGNNDLSYDPFTEYFRVDVKDVYFNIDVYNGIVVANLQNFYKGVINDTKARGLAYYDEQLNAFLDENRSFENINQMINYSETDNGIIEKYLFWDTTYIAMIRLIDTPHIIAFRIFPKPIKNIPIWSFSTLDYIEDESCILLNEKQIIPFIIMLRDNIKFNRFKFTSSLVKEKVVELMYNYRNVELQDLYKK